MDQQAEKKIRQSSRTRQKKKKGDSKVESNDSPEIPDKGETSDISGLPSGVGTRSFFSLNTFQNGKAYTCCDHVNVWNNHAK